MRHYSNILQLDTQMSRSSSEAFAEAFIDAYGLCAQYKAPTVCVQIQGFSESYNAEAPSFQFFLLEASQLAPWWEHKVGRTGDESASFERLEMSPFSVCMSDSEVSWCT